MFDQNSPNQPDNNQPTSNNFPPSGNIPRREPPVDLYQKVNQDNSQANMQISPRNTNEPEDILGDVDTDNTPAPVQRPSLPNAGFGSAVPPNIPQQSLEPTRSSGGSKKVIFLVLIIVVLALVGVAGFMAYQLFMTTPTTVPTQNINQNINTNNNQNSNQQVIFEEPEIEEPLEPVLVDSDGDNLNDDEEKIYGTNPLSVDTDVDGLTDRDEIEVFGTDPLNPDTDGDGFTDGEEVRAEYDPKGPGVLFGTERQNN